MARKLPAPPSSITGILGTWLQKLHLHIESQPNWSLASFGDTPNSLVTGRPGDLVTNIGSASTASRLWLLGGDIQSVLTDQGWVLVRVLE